MTHALPASTPVAPYRSSMRAARVTFPRLIRAEWIALFSVRSTYITLIVGGGLALLLAAYTAYSWGADPTLPPFTSTPVQALLFAQIAATLIGAGLYSRENSSGSLRTQFAAAPRRVPILLAKATALLLSIFTLGVILIVLTLAVSATVYTVAGREVDVNAMAIVAVVLGGGGLLALTSVLGFGVAMIVRSEALTITVVLVILLVAPALLQLAGQGQLWTITVSDLLFGNSGNALLTPITWSNTDGMRHLAVVLLWPAAAFGLGALFVARRDA